MTPLEVQNNQSFRVDEIAFQNENIFYDNILNSLSNGFRMIGLCPIDINVPQKITAILADPHSASLHIIGGEFAKDNLEFKSLANEYPHTNYYECELAENNGFKLLHHPWLRPVRKQNIIEGDKPYNFYKLEGDEVHEVAVGPIHAGIIEPGHFRFQCHGELVYHLEINLGYQHRGVEALIRNANPAQRIILSESIAGDTVVGHTYAHCSAIESLSNISISLRAQVIRSVAEELERIAMHLSGLGGIANDIGLSIVSSSYGRLRALVIKSMAELCGSRFGRGLLTYGGVRYDFNDVALKKIISNLEIVKKDAAEINNFLFSSTGALTRFDGTGTVTKNLAKQIGMVGTAARASGIEIDARINSPYGAYRYFPVSLITLQTGDVFARARLRALEIDESLHFIFEQIQNLPEGKLCEYSPGGKAHPGNVEPNSGVISIVEGWRGEVMHTAFTDTSGKIIQYKIKDPSFNNWYALSLALRQTAISDFPVCNKSFDLSYAGHDL